MSEWHLNKVFLKYRQGKVFFTFFSEFERFLFMLDEKDVRWLECH